MITCERLTYSYPSGAVILRGLDLHIPEGAFVLVTGVSGAGKSTLLRAFNGLVPHFHGGMFGGAVRVNGQNTLQTPPRALASTVGFVFQDPEAQFVTPTVEDEIAFGLENQGIAPDEMQRRIESALDMLAIRPLRRARIDKLSGGQQQRVALAAALALQPRCLVLDEPTSQLDPIGAHELLDHLVELNCRHRLTIILAEHRLERVVRHATHLLHLDTGGLHFGPVRELLPRLPLQPPVVGLALRMGWHPLPLTVDEARPFVDGLAATHPHPPGTPPTTGETALEVRGLTVGYNGKPVITGLDWHVGRGEIVGLLGVNGAGKSTLLKAIVGLLRPTAGQIRVMGEDPTRLKRHTLARLVGYVPQNPNAVLFAETLRDEMQFTLRNHGLPGDGAMLLARLGLEGHSERYPRDLSGGERQRAALAAMLAAEPPVILLDEPTRGLDYQQKRGLRDLLREWAGAGAAIVVATHDVEWIAGLAGRAIVLAEGKIQADGPTGRVLLETPGFNTQLGELLARPDWLTLEQMLPPTAVPHAVATR